MREQDKLKVDLTKEELERIKRAAAAHGLDVETWAREVILRRLRRDDSGTQREPAS